MAVTSGLRANPAYSRMMDELRGEIASGRLVAGDRIAGEVALGEQYGISVTSVRRGIEMLVEDGLITRRQGSGTYVTGQLAATAPPAASVVKRDTIGIVNHVQVHGYHPYYTELHQGLRAGLAQYGWKLWEPASGSMRGQFGQAPYNWDRDKLWADIGGREELAGMFIRPSLLPKTADWQPTCRLVMPDIWPETDYVAYSWEREIEDAMRYLLEQGARRIWMLGVFPDAVFRRTAARAAGALGVAVPELIVRQTTDQVQNVSECIHRAYALASEDFAVDTGIDGIFVGSDFETQGAMDALAGSPLAAAKPACIALVNKESRLSVARPIARLILDGYGQGQALADVLHESITNPQSATRQVLLRARFEAAR